MCLAIENQAASACLIWLIGFPFKWLVYCSTVTAATLAMTFVRSPSKVLA